MKRIRALSFLALAILAVPAGAALPVGSKAPDIRTMGALGGKSFRLDLKEQLRSGPVVLYFFPKAFTEGCTLEAKAFADAMPRFRAAGARVVGMSADNLATLKRFSTEACRSRFPVATASAATIRSYDVVLKSKPELTDRTSYVIARDGRIVMVHSDLDWKQHVDLTLAAVRDLKAKAR
jgi:peroxiredoxin